MTRLTVDELRELPFSPGYDRPLWSKILVTGREVHPVPGDDPGPHGCCWVNARKVVLADPDRYRYAEGVVVSLKPRYGPGYMLQARRLYPHAWIIDENDQRIEVTEGWTARCDTATYIEAEPFKASSIRSVLDFARYAYRDAPAEARAEIEEVSLLELLRMMEG